MSESETDLRLAVMLGGTVDERRDALATILEGSVMPGDQAVAALMELLRHESKEVRRRGADALAAAFEHEGLRGAIKAGLESENLDTRWGVAFALSQARFVDERVFDAACDAMGCGDGDIRWSASQIVCGYAKSNPNSLDALRTRARDGNAQSRKMALYCLRNLGTSDTEAFLRALNDSNSGVRLAALAGLSRIGEGDPSVLKGVRARVLGDEEPGVRRAAAAALGAIAGGDKESRSVLERAADEPDADLVRAARAALRRLA